jgi:hypothetical protein
LTPDLIALNLFSNADDPDYVDCFVILSEIDGQFRSDKQQRFNLVKHTAVLAFDPVTGYDSQEQLVTVKVTSVLPEPTLLVRLRTRETENAASYTVY